MRLLKLPAEIQACLRDGSLSMGQARTLINIDDDAKQIFIARRTIAQGLSVRDVEKLVQQLNKIALPQTRPIKTALPLKYESMKQSIEQKFDRKVELKRSLKGSGAISIPFASDDDLQALITLFGIE